MLSISAQHMKDVSVLRRLLFAAVHLPPELPNFWSLVVEFATIQRNPIDPKVAESLIRNIESFDKAALSDDNSLRTELISWGSGHNDLPGGKLLGVVLITKETSCILCGSKLSIRNERPAYISVYDRNIGPVPGMHYHKECTNKQCPVTQYYGYYSTGGARSRVFYNKDWMDYPYFVSLTLTAFSMSTLREVDVQLLIGQLSYQQIAEIFNQVHSNGLHPQGVM